MSRRMGAASAGELEALLGAWPAPVDEWLIPRANMVRSLARSACLCRCVQAGGTLGLRLAQDRLWARRSRQGVLVGGTG